MASQPHHAESPDFQRSLGLGSVSLQLDATSTSGAWELTETWGDSDHQIWLVVTGTSCIFTYIGNFVIPTDELIFFQMG